MNKTNKLKERRQAEGLTQTQLAERTGITLLMIRKYEQGQRDINKAQCNTVLRLAKALNCTIEDIIDGV